MDAINHTLPDDVEELKRIIDDQLTEIERASSALEDYKKKFNDLKNNYGSLSNEYDDLNHKFQYLKKLFFGKKSEKITPEDVSQGRLFNEAESSVDEADDENSSKTEEKKNESDINEAGDADSTVVKSHTRRKAGRKPIPENIPRKEIIHDLTDEEKKCGCCGKSRPLIGTEETEELEYIPAIILVNKHIYPKYGPCKCEDFFKEQKPEVISALAQKRMIPGSIVSEGLLSFVITSKFCDAIPFYRQSKMFRRIDVDISRATMCNWMMNSFEQMNIFFEEFKANLKSGEFIRMDETTVQVLHEAGKSPESKSYMWVAIGYPARGRPLVLYEYHPTRAGSVPMEFLEGFKGYLQTDGYAGYEAPAKKHGLIHVGCFAHARREFHKAYDPKNKNSRAYKALMIIRKIYEIESDLRARNLSDDIFVGKRKAAVSPVLAELHAFLVQTKEIITPSSLVGKAVDYTLNQWDKLIRYLDLACMTPDNNEIERSIKNFVIGRKNWMFSNTARGANASAGMYSLVESAKANGLDPYLYLRFLFARLPYVRDNRNELRKLLPCFVSSDDIKIAE